MDAEHRTKIGRESDSLSETILQLEQHGRRRWVDATCLIIIQFTYLALTPFFCYTEMSPKHGDIVYV